MVDHELFFARVVEVGAGRLKEPPLLYSSRLGWRVTGDKAREPGAASATSCSTASPRRASTRRRSTTDDDE